ncbi:MAG: hypothetical protein KBF21_14225 [Thermoanaerobaculia bacterium]|nr:hypothetical protein [Thermoanaerobaculia bacterium]
MAGLLDDEDLTPDGPPSSLPPLPDDVEEEPEQLEDGEEVIVLEDEHLEEDTRPTPAQTAREKMQGTMTALLEQLERDAKPAGGNLEDELAMLRMLEARTRVAKQLAEAHRDILALQSIPDPDRADRDRKGSLSRLAAALRHAHGAPVTTRPPGEE